MPPHAVNPPPHETVHMPSTQSSPEPQALPQPPQAIRSAGVSRQTPMHSVKPAPHMVWHMPRKQNCPKGHERPQAPQLRMSFEVSVHISPPPEGPASAFGVGHCTWSSPQRMRQRPSWQT
jgi:hypothetical protein